MQFVMDTDSAGAAFVRSRWIRVVDGFELAGYEKVVIIGLLFKRDSLF
jgi:hypothetical protein